MKILNIYGQLSYHTEARIIGNQAGLMALRAAIERALMHNKATTETDVMNGGNALFASDGEGYEVIVECHNDEWGIKAPKDSYWNTEASLPEYTMYLESP